MSKKLSLRSKKQQPVESLDPSVKDKDRKNEEPHGTVKDATVFRDDISKDNVFSSESSNITASHPSSESDETQAVVKSTQSQNKGECPICNELILLDVIKTHVLLCLKRYQNPKVQPASKCDVVESVDCAVCGKDLQLLSLDMRQSHVEKCLGNEESAAMTARGSIGCNLDPRFALTSTTISKLYKKSKHLNPPKTPNQEELHLAKALSLSLANSDAWGSLQPCKNVNLNSRKIKQLRKGFQVAPTLLMRTREERNKLINEEVAAVIANNQDLHVYDTDERVKAENWKEVHKGPSFKDQIMKVHPNIVVKDVSKLWHLATLGDKKSVELEDYYVSTLNWAIMPCKTAPIPRFKHLSQIPGRHSQSDIETNLRSSQGDAQIVSASTQAVLENLACRNNLLPDMKCNMKGSHDWEFGNGGFCTQIAQEDVFAATCEHTKLVNDLEHVFMTGKFADVDIITENLEKLPCHKMILFARCPALIHEIVDETPTNIETKNSKIMWKNVSSSAARDFVKYLYTAEITTAQLTKEIANLASKYNMEDLEELCYMYLGSETESDNEDDVIRSESPSMQMNSDDDLQTCSNAEKIEKLTDHDKHSKLNFHDDHLCDCEPEIQLDAEQSNSGLGNISQTESEQKWEEDYSNLSGCEEVGRNSPDLFEPCIPEVSKERFMSSDTPCSSRLKSRKRQADYKYKDCCSVSTPVTTKMVREQILELSSLESKGKKQKFASNNENDIVVILDVEQERPGNVDDEPKQNCGMSVLMNDTLDNFACNDCNIWDGFDDNGFGEDYHVLNETPKCDIQEEMDGLEDDEEIRSQSSSSPAVLVLANDTDTSEEKELVTLKCADATRKPMASVVLGPRTSVNAITPMPEYSDMDTPTLKVNLNKYGLRGQKRKRAVRLLKHIYDKTHPVVPESESDEECCPMVAVSEQRFDVADTGDLQAEPQPLNCSQESSASSCWSSSVEVPEESLFNVSSDEDISCKSKMDPSNLANILRKFFKSDNELYREILLYNPISIDYIQGLLKAANIRIETKALINFLDTENITFKMPRKTRKPGRRIRNCTVRKPK